MMVVAVKDGEAKWTNVTGYNIAGKTGTAQVAVGGKYADTVTNASFIGFAPADQTQICDASYLKRTENFPVGLGNCAPLWFNIMPNY